MKKPLSLFPILMVVFFACSRPEKVDFLITNGKVWTGNSSQPWAEWVAVEGYWILDPVIGPIRGKRGSRWTWAGA